MRLVRGMTLSRQLYHMVGHIVIRGGSVLEMTFHALEKGSDVFQMTACGSASRGHFGRRLRRRLLHARQGGPDVFQVGTSRLAGGSHFRRLRGATFRDAEALADGTHFWFLYSGRGGNVGV